VIDVGPQALAFYLECRNQLHAVEPNNPTHVVKPGQVFVPMHYAAMNRLTFPAFDPYSRQPSYKHCAVRIRRLEAADSEL
jgi:anaerobic selenocysteine-containing dehydrogenase